MEIFYIIIFVIIILLLSILNCEKFTIKRNDYENNNHIFRNFSLQSIFGYIKYC
jgi:hypothetical protein